MEVVDQNNQNPNSNQDWENRVNEHIKHRRIGKIFAGIIIVIVGAAMLAREMGVYFPEWLFSWPMLLIVIGLWVGVSHAFRNFGWIVLILVGSAFMFKEHMPYMHIKEYFWPMFIMMIGLIVIFKPRRKWDTKDYHYKHGRMHHGRFRHRRGDRPFCSYKEDATSTDDMVNMDIVFSGFKKNIISKDFKGGKISCVFGGGKLNLSQADINGSVILEVDQVFGGVEIIVPPNWQVQTNEMQATFGGIEDKHHVQGGSLHSDKVLVIKGSVVFGGIEIRSY